jgi:hypothetical protein
MTEAAAAPAAGATDLLPAEQTPETATARIVELKADPAFLERYLGGEMKARDEFTRLHGLAVKGPVNTDGIHRSIQLAALKKHADLPPQCWDQVANNGPVAPFEREEALRMKERCIRDKAWVSRWLDGSREEVSLLTRISLILASPVKTEG